MTSDSFLKPGATGPVTKWSQFSTFRKNSLPNRSHRLRVWLRIVLPFFTYLLVIISRLTLVVKRIGAYFACCDLGSSTGPRELADSNFILPNSLPFWGRVVCGQPVGKETFPLWNRDKPTTMSKRACLPCRWVMQSAVPIARFPPLTSGV